jgi:quinol---cytochrome c reductase cytochrome c subunit, bacillus type
MTEIPESLLRRSAEAKAKALGLPVEQVLAEMKGEGPPIEIPQPQTEVAVEPEVVAEVSDGEEIEEAIESVEPEPEPVEETPPEGGEPSEDVEVEVTSEAEVAPAPPTEAPESADPVPEPVAPAAAVATAVEDRPEPSTNGSGNGSGNGKVASMVTARPTVPPKGTPEGVRTQRLLTVVKARAIQNVKAEPTDKVNTWPHLMLMEFSALLAITGFVIILAIIIHSPLLDPANFNSTPNPSKAPWYFLGLQELLSYFDPQIAGVMVPTVTGLIGFMMIPFVDKNPSTRPTDRKYAIALYSVFMAGAATLTMFGVLFRGRGFNFSYPWKDGVFFDDLKDWIDFG